MRLVYYFDTNLDYLGSGEVSTPKGYSEPLLPQMGTWVQPPLYDKDTHTVKYIKESDNWQLTVKLIPVDAYHKVTQAIKRFEDATLVGEEYTTEKPTSPHDEWDGGKWVFNKDNAFSFDMDALNKEYDESMLKLSNEYSVAVARDGSTETEKVSAVRTRIVQLDSEFETNRTSLINKYFGV